jgi:hypothetical protein
VGDKVMNERGEKDGKAAGCGSSTAAQVDAGRVRHERWRAVVCKSYLGEVELLGGALVVPAAFISFHPRH